MEFKIIAVKPLINCDKKFLKVLTIDEPYYLCTNFSIANDRIVVNNANSIPKDLYTLESGLKINISAIVGKNGSGKSTIVELMYAVIFNASCVTGILSENSNKQILPEHNLFVSLYYQKGEGFYWLECKGEQVKLFKQNGIRGKMKSLHRDSVLKRSDLKSLFYSIAVNYSHYSLNEIHSNQWLKHLFHKNDGYQTPLVINPFREDGIIGINNEEQLTLSRIVANLLSVRPDNKLYNELAPGKKASHVKFTLNKKKVNPNNFTGVIAIALKQKRREILEVVFSFFPVAKWEDYLSADDDNLKTALDYLCQKLYKITDLYKPYKGKQFQFLTDKKRAASVKEKVSDADYSFSLANLKRLLQKMKDNPSHINFKFEQTITFLNNYSFYKPLIGKLISLNELAVDISKIASKNKANLIISIPPSFFSIDIKFENKGYLRSLSSGEKQKIYSEASWLYHLINLNSVKEEEEIGYIKYDCINFIFDEIELYYHPEMQRTFVFDFLKALERFQISPEIGVNCIFITHSPFILSDIPNQNILFLNKDGKIDGNAGISKTFGANIHDLLKSNFFMEDGPMGKFAQEKIKSLISFLNDVESLVSIEWEKGVADQFIDMISEPIIKKSLRNLFDFKYKTDIELQTQINNLQKQLDKRIKSKS